MPLPSIQPTNCILVAFPHYLVSNEDVVNGDVNELDEETNHYASPDKMQNEMLKSPEDDETGNENEIQAENIETHKQAVETIQRRIIKVGLPEGRLGVVLKDGPGCSNKVIVKGILDESPLMGKFILLESL